ncbi:hypothetical protein AAVH_29116 [Aphelenchoides avenae]|nr:hypothetical protein AAVH_29116 [Aphelenchus avenae]
MYYFLLLFSVAVVSGSSLKPTEKENRNVADKIRCGPWPLYFNFYRAYRADIHDHFYTTDSAEFDDFVNNFGYASEGVTAGIYVAPAGYTVPVYRLWQAKMNDHFYTTNATERDEAIRDQAYRDEGVAGYVFIASTVEPLCPCPEARPLYRLFKEGSLLNYTVYDHFYTLNATEKALFVSEYGYNDEGIAACTFSPPPE